MCWVFKMREIEREKHICFAAEQNERIWFGSWLLVGCRIGFCSLFMQQQQSIISRTHTHTHTSIHINLLDAENNKYIISHKYTYIFGTSYSTIHNINGCLYFLLFHRIQKDNYLYALYVALVSVYVSGAGGMSLSSLYLQTASCSLLLTRMASSSLLVLLLLPISWIHLTHTHAHMCTYTHTSLCTHTLTFQLDLID